MTCWLGRVLDPCCSAQRRCCNLPGADFEICRNLPPSQWKITPTNLTSDTSGAVTGGGWAAVHLSYHPCPVVGSRAPLCSVVRSVRDAGILRLELADYDHTRRATKTANLSRKARTHFNSFSFLQSLRLSLLSVCSGAFLLRLKV